MALISIFVLTLEFLLFFFLIRGVNRMYTDSILRKRQRQKLKYSNFWDWLLYKQHYKILPKSRIIWYFSIFFEYIISIIIILICHFTPFNEVGRYLVYTYFMINAFVLLGSEFGMIWFFLRARFVGLSFLFFSSFRLLPNFDPSVWNSPSVRFVFSRRAVFFTFYGLFDKKKMLKNQ